MIEKKACAINKKERGWTSIWNPLCIKCFLRKKIAYTQRIFFILQKYV